MRVTFHLLVALLVIVSYNELIAQEYAGTAYKDFSIDAPWRVSSFGNKIPISITIKDANTNDCLVDTIQIWIFDKLNNRDSLIHQKIFGGIIVNNKRWEYLWEISIDELNSTPFNLSINQSDTLKLHVRLSFRDNVLPEYFTQHLRVFATNSNFLIFDNWFSGDTHFHSLRILIISSVGITK